MNLKDAKHFFPFKFSLIVESFFYFLSLIIESKCLN